VVQLIDNGMLILQIDQNYTQIVMGVAIVAAVVLDQAKGRLNSRGR
jgi:ribose/xylose/arabinose/galactoside ABC-type transport system permease subunit